MKNIFKSTLLIAALATSVSAFAVGNEATVDIQIDPEFMNKNIIFVIENDQQEVGMHRAGESLMSHMLVDTTLIPNSEYRQVRIQAFLTDASLTRSTLSYISRNDYQFKPNAHIGLSFPVMFSER